MRKIIVHKCGSITSIGRYTRILFAAEALAQENMMCPDTAIKREFECREDKAGVVIDD